MSLPTGIDEMRSNILGGAAGRGTVPVSEGLHSVTEITQQMPPVSHLDRRRCALANAIRISASAITGDDLNTGMIA
jgi:hypothetical protein